MLKLFTHILILSATAFVTINASAQSSGLYAKRHFIIHDTLQITKLNQQNNYNVITIDPNPSSGNIRVKNMNPGAKEVHFYVFDMDGVMIENLRLAAWQVKKVTGLRKGVYLYDVFEKDESIERGKIIVQ
ncbi:MAG: T9SS type A sorting domain-containing protein [Chitinophagaceae bacterium]|jgi:predicted secreted acid phosphatase|nr:T9SS type A sorting domain-containing protein [Chitinophagaceae bacterium]